MDVPLEKREIGLIAKILKKKGLTKENFIELGCGDGFNLRVFEKLRMNGEGVELSKEAIGIARQKKFNNIKLINKDINQLSYKNENLIFLLNVLEHVKDDAKLLKKISTFLKKNGCLFLSIPAHKKSYGYADLNAGHYRRYERDEIKDKLEKAGFEAEKILSVGFPVCNFYTWFFNKCMKIIKKGAKLEEEKTATSGIKLSEAYYPPPFNFLAEIAFPILTILIKLDFLFLNTDLGNNYIIIARKK